MTIADVLARDRVIIASCVIVTTALAWMYLILLSGEMSISRSAMQGMNAPWSVTDYLLTFAMWSVMMVGMMTPSATAVLVLFDGMQKNAAAGQRHRKVLLFAVGYIIVWIAFSAFAALAQWALHERAILSMSMATTSKRLAGSILILAGVYQLTPFKSACLRQCRTPLGFIMTNWREGDSGALVMGLRHGMYCLGCCWALMLVLFVVGVMNLAWVAALAAFILIEKFGRGGALIARIGGVVTIAAGIILVIR